MEIQDFDSYCRALGAGDPLAALTAYVRGWMIQVQALDDGTDEEKRGYVGLTELLEPCGEPEGDEISRIVASTREAFAHVTGQLHERILRENVMLPIYRAKEIGSAGLNWLSKRSGRTIREKLSTTKSMLAVRRRMSYDTGENRLLLAFTEQLEDAVEKKRTAAPALLIDAERAFQSRALTFFKSEEADDIGRWENVPPNNTLLSDRWYRQIWKGWNDLQNVSSLIRSDAAHLSARVGTVFFWNVLRAARPYCYFLQQPVAYRLQEFHLSPALGSVCGMHPDYGTFTASLRQGDGRTEALFAFGDVMLGAIFTADDMELVRAGTPVAKEPLTCGALQKFVETAKNELFHGCSQIKQTAARAPKDALSAAMFLDLFSTRPLCRTDGGASYRLPFRLLRQDFTLEDGTPADLSVASATGWYLSPEAPSYSVTSCLHDKAHGAQDARLTRLVRMLLCALPRKHVRQLHLPLPDLYDEFQMGAIRKALHVCYPDVHTMPRSMAVLFAEIGQRTFQAFQPGDFALFVDYVHGHVSLTLAQASYHESIEQALPETRGLVWERHPTASERCEAYSTRLKERLLREGLQLSEQGLQEVVSVLGTKGLPLEGRRLAVAEGDGTDWQMLTDAETRAFAEEKYDVTAAVKQFLSERREMVGPYHVYVYLVSPHLECHMSHVTRRDQPDLPLSGMQAYARMDETCEVYSREQEVKLPPLWTDQLPALAIKQMIGTFDLIRAGGQARIVPELGHEQEISIPNVFTLPKDEPEPRFGLIMGQGNTDISYEAVIHHPAFPLKKDTPCSLRLTYTYGRDIPYTLVFEPQTSDAPFREAEVAWENAKERPYLDLPVPEYPEDKETWETLQHGFTKRKKDVHYRDWIENVFTGRVLIDLDEAYVDARGNGNYMIQYELENGEQAVISVWDPKQELGLEAYAEDDEDDDTSHQFLSCLLEPDTRHRSRIHMPDGAWRRSRQGDYYVYLKVDTDQDVAFYENNILFGDDVDAASDADLTFVVKPRKDGKLLARDIVVMDDDYTFYRAKAATLGDMPYNLRSLSVLYPLHQVYANGRTTQTAGCPAHFRQAMQNVAHDLPFQYFLKAFRAGDGQMTWDLFRIMCVLSLEIGKPFYDAAGVMLRKKPNLIDEDLGCALGACDNEMEFQLLKDIYASALDDFETMAILSKAAWKDRRFIEHAPASLLLQSFEVAAQTVIACRPEKDAKKNNYLAKRILKCLEYILAIFRLRERRDENLCRRLSLNHPTMRKLYEAVERLATEGFELPDSRLQLEIHREDDWKDIPDFYYAVLTYVTGTTSQIRISGILENEE